MTPPPLDERSSQAPGPEASAQAAAPANQVRLPSIAVVITVYNMAHLLPRAVFSALWQLEPQDELIVVDDASSDLADFAGLRPFLDRITWLRNRKNLGLPGSRNRAILSTQADWIKFLDADDVLAPYALDVVRRAEPPIPPDIQLLAGGCHRVVDSVYLDFLFSTDESVQDIMKRNILLPSAVFVRRSALLEVGLFDDRLDFEEDWDMWLRLNERYGLQAFAHTMVPFCYYWLSDMEGVKKKKRTGLVEGIPIREYFRKRYNADPE